MWRIILENGVRSCNFTAKDLCSFAQTCKLFLQVGSEDSIWSPLLVVDSFAQTCKLFLQVGIEDSIWSPLLVVDANKEEPYWLDNVFWSNSSDLNLIPNHHRLWSPKADFSFSASSTTPILLRCAMNTCMQRMQEEISTQQEKDMLAIQEGSL
ncbi:hypothetical protein ACFE04_004554 [Oxalis oulophora]